MIFRFGITREGRVFVTQVAKNGNADRYGRLQVGEEICTVDGQVHTLCVLVI